MKFYTAKYYYPGIIVSEVNEKDVADTDYETVSAEDAGNWYAVDVFSQDKDLFTSTTGEERWIPVGKPENICRYVKGDKFCLTEVYYMAQHDESFKPLLDNMRGNGWNYVVKSNNGQWVQWLERDILV